MFIRKTIKSDRKTGKKYTSYQLVEAFRTSLGPRQRILLTIDSDILLSTLEQKTLANRIEEITKGSLSFFPCPDNIEALAQHYAKLLLLKQNAITVVNEIEDPPDFHKIDINSIKHTKVRTIGPEYIAFSMYQELGFDEVFNRLKFSKKQKEAAAATIIGRAIYPSSEKALHNYLRSRSGLEQLLNTDFSNLSLDQLYAISDRLYDEKNVLEKHLCKRERDLFDLQEKIILYDITNTYFEGSCKSHSKAKRGKSKEMRFDCPLVAFGVVLDVDGFPKHSEFFEGNVNERATLQEMILRLNKINKSQKPIIVLDSGIATKDNVEWLKEQGYLYIVMMKNKERPHADNCNDVIIKKNKDQHISATLKHDPVTDDHLLWCYSEMRRKKEQDIKQHKANAFEEGLEKLKSSVRLQRGIKTIEKVHQKIGRLREKHTRLAQHYDIVVTPAEDFVLAKDITWSYNAAKIEKSFGGTYTLRTNAKDLSAENIWKMYVMLSEAESCFRCLKSEAGFRPNWHHREERINGHMFISLLAYHLIISIRKKLRAAEIMDSWESIKATLSSHVVVNTTFKKQNEDMIYLKKASEAEGAHQKIYTALGLTFRPVKTEKSILGKM